MTLSIREGICKKNQKQWQVCTDLCSVAQICVVWPEEGPVWTEMLLYLMWFGAIVRRLFGIYSPLYNYMYMMLHIHEWMHERGTTEI